MIVLLVVRAVGDRAVLDRLRDAQPAWLALAVAGEAITFAAFAAALRGALALDGGPTMRASG